MYGAQSEYKPLRRVLMHTPRKSLRLVNERTYREFLFTTPVFRKKFVREHELFVDLLRSEGVEVLLIEDVLKADTEGLKQIARLPNLVYTRDTISVTNAGYIRMRMASKARGQEPAVSEKAAAVLGIPPLLQVSKPGLLEGGDFVYLDEETLLVGEGKRSNRAATLQLIRMMLKKCVKEVVAAQLMPWNVHLDGMIMFVDRDLALVHSDSLRKPAYVFAEDEKPQRIELIRWLRSKEVRMIEVDPLDRFLRCSNVVCLAPRKCAMYMWSEKTANNLKDHGVETLEFEGLELLRGGGGPHCMTAPILRQ